MKEHIRFSIFRINTIQKINVKKEKESKSFQVVGWFYNFSQDCIRIGRPESGSGPAESKLLIKTE